MAGVGARLDDDDKVEQRRWVYDKRRSCYFVAKKTGNGEGERRGRIRRKGGGEEGKKKKKRKKKKEKEKKEKEEVKDESILFYLNP